MIEKLYLGSPGSILIRCRSASVSFYWPLMVSRTATTRYCCFLGCVMRRIFVFLDCTAEPHRLSLSRPLSTSSLRSFSPLSSSLLLRTQHFAMPHESVLQCMADSSVAFIRSIPSNQPLIWYKSRGVKASALPF